MIPNIIWQTYKTPINDIPNYAKECIQSWHINNPEYQHFYMDDESAASFILQEYGEEWHSIFLNCKIGVMRGDIWRYLIIYKHGGIYADVDTLCKYPASTWIKPSYDFILAPESEKKFCQWTFAAAPGSPIMKAVIDEMKIRLKNIDYTKPDFIHDTTGPHLWTEAILGYLEATTENIILDADKINLLPKAIESNLYVYGKYQWKLFNGDIVQHMYASSTWNDGQWTQWKEDPIFKNVGHHDKYKT